MTAIVVGNKQPLYRQIARTLRQRIRTREYGQREPLPSIRTLAREFDVSICVVQRAIRVLEEDGVLASHHGKAVTVDQTEPCSRAAIIFGLIQPFTTGMQLRVSHDAEKVFSERDNFVVVRTSEDDAEKERRIAEHLVDNGISGLLVWPIEQSPNGPFFQKLSERLPVVLVDRLMARANLPAVVPAMREGGREICRYMFEQRKRRKLVALIDEGDLSSYRDLMKGLREEATAMGRDESLVIHRWPIIELVEQFSRADFSSVDRYVAELERLLDRDVDALLCPQSDFIDVVVVQSGLVDRHGSLVLGTTADPEFNQHTRRYCESGIVQWRVGHAQAIAWGADLLQQWILTRQRPRGTLTVPVKRL